VSCGSVRKRLSAYVDGELSAAETGTVASHLHACDECSAVFRSLTASLELLGELPRLDPPEPIASRIQDRLEVESRGPGLQLVFRPAWRARPLMVPSLFRAALVLGAVVAVSLALDRAPEGMEPPSVRPAGESWEGRRMPPSGTEANPLFPSAGVSVPQVRASGAFSDRLLASIGEGSLFLETVVARDGSVSTVTLIDGDSEAARPLLEALRQQRFEPGRFRGRPVAVSLYRLISRMEVRAPIT
jgi:hypothetical protein